MKKIVTTLVISFVFFLTGCQKNYSCVCTTIPGNNDTLIDKVKTTRTGSKYYRKFCADFENQRSGLKDCHLE